MDSGANFKELLAKDKANLSSIRIISANDLNISKVFKSLSSYILQKPNYSPLEDSRKPSHLT